MLRLIALRYTASLKWIGLLGRLLRNHRPHMHQPGTLHPKLYKLYIPKTRNPKILNPKLVTYPKPVVFPVADGFSPATDAGSGYMHKCHTGPYSRSAVAHRRQGFMGLGFRVQGLGFRGLGFRGLGFRV